MQYGDGFSQTINPKLTKKVLNVCFENARFLKAFDRTCGKRDEILKSSVC